MPTSNAVKKSTVRKRLAQALPGKHVNGATQKVLLACGIVSSLWYIATNVVVPLYYPGYNAASQVVSELSAIGAPTRVLWVVLCTIYSLLVMAFGVGVRQVAGQNRKLKTVGLLLLANGFIGFFWPPMHQREVLAAGGATLSDTLHIVFTMVTVPLMILVIIFGSTAFGKRFRLYSYATLAVLAAAGVLTGLDSPKLSTNQPTPWIGVWERINIGVYMVWVMVFSTLLLHQKSGRYFDKKSPFIQSPGQ